MNDAELTQALRHIGVDRHTVRALPLLPLVQVAWADGRIQAAERGLIREVAARYGLNKREIRLLDRWLSKRPEEADFLLARQVLLVLWSRDRARGEAPESLDGVIRMCMCVARVAGGLFGLAFTMDRRERELIGEISQSLQLGPTLTKAARAVLPDKGPRPGRSIADDVTTILRRTPASQAETPRLAHRLAGPIDPTDGDEAYAAVRPKGQGPAEPRAPDDITTARHATLDPEGAPEASAPEPAASSAVPDGRHPEWLRADETSGRHPAMPRSRTGAPGETLLPAEDKDEDDSATVPLASLKRILEEEEATEVDIPMVPADYDWGFD